MFDSNFLGWLFYYRLGRLEAQAVSVDLSGLRTERSSRPSSMPAAVIQALIPCFTQIGMATVRMRRAPVQNVIHFPAR